MSNREKYTRLCEQEELPLHAQAWWWEKASTGKEWDAILLEDAKGNITAAMPFHLVRRLGIPAVLMPVHTQYHYVYTAPDAPPDIYTHLVQTFEETCRKRHIGWIQLQGFYPAPLLDAFHASGFDVTERVTYRIDAVPSRQEMEALFSENKRRQLHKAVDLHVEDMTVEAFYRFHHACMEAQGKRIDYSASWARSVLHEAVARRQGRLIAAQNADGRTLAAMFLAWDNKQCYYLHPSYDPMFKKSGAMAWLTAQALEEAHRKGLQFDFEGSMIPSIASSYKQFGGRPVTYHRMEKFFNPFIRVAVRLRQRL